MRTIKFWVTAFVVFVSFLDTHGEVLPISIDSIQSLFKAGKIVSLRDNIACYRLNGLEHNGGAYGYCLFDDNYIPSFSTKGQSWDKNEGMLETIINSKCYITTNSSDKKQNKGYSRSPTSSISH